MCNIHTIYHTLCGCYSKPRMYDEPCIRAVKGAGLSRGCWHKTDMGVTSEDSVCRRCLGLSSRSGSFCSGFSFGSGCETDVASLSGETLVESKRASEVSSVDSATTLAEQEGEEEVRAGMFAEGEGSVCLTVPDAVGSLKRVESMSSFESTSTTISAFTAAECARSLISCLPEKIRPITRNESGVAVSYWKLKSRKVEGEDENLHWRMYDGRRYEHV